MNPNSVFLAELYNIYCRQCTPPSPRSLWIDIYRWFLAELNTIFCRQCTPHQTPQRDLRIDTYHWFLAELITIPCRQCTPPPTPKEVYGDIKVPGLNPNSMFWLDCWGLFFTPPLEPIGGENICRKNKRRCQILPYKIQT